jgi:thioredoxin-dependent peroxiredoxin
MDAGIDHRAHQRVRRRNNAMTLEQGQPAPDFELADGDGKMWSLRELKGQKVILYFYPADDTPGCTVQACDFRDTQQEFIDAGYVVLGVSPQGEKSHRRFTEKFDLNFPLLIDNKAEVAKAYGAYKKLGDWKGIPLIVKRSTFVIDENGNIEQALYGVKAKGHVAGLKESVGITA